MGWSFLVHVAGGVWIAVIATKIQATSGGTEGLLDTWVGSDRFAGDCQ